MEYLLEAEHITAGYIEDVDVLQEVSVRVIQGSITGMIGLNGAGKSTFVKTVFGFLKPKKGRILLEKDDITGIEPHILIRKGLWYLPQESSLFPHLTIEDNLLIPTRVIGLRSYEIRDRLEHVYTRFPELKANRKRHAGDLSGGQQKILEFAKVLMVKPRLLFIDEPTVGISPKIAAEIYTMIQQFLGEGTSVFLIDHNLRKLVDLTDYVYVMSLGRIVAEGPSSQFQDSLKEQVQRWLGL
ncbi:MAG: ATP-binding cassette domain-containing protein [Armatimonadota bacterium]|nr:ATP-binding cassette domain-containing protein [Armatimonadota bacterium]